MDSDECEQVVEELLTGSHASIHNVSRLECNEERPAKASPVTAIEARVFFFEDAVEMAREESECAERY